MTDYKMTDNNRLTDLVAKLRSIGRNAPICTEAADTIDAQRKWINVLDAEVSDYMARALKLEAALNRAMNHLDQLDCADLLIELRVILEGKDD
jgi:hypothetical protein